MGRISGTCWCLALIAAVAGAQETRLPQRLLFVGQATHEERAASFERFLAGRFADVRRVTHETVTPEAVAGADVVLLDWRQDGDTPMPPPRCPLGERNAWTKPTVLLGSAGLYVACLWKVNGGAG